MRRRWPQQRELLQSGEFDRQQAWQVATNWLNKKYKPVHVEAINRAADDLQGVGWAINRFPKKQTPLLSSPTLLRWRGPILAQQSSEGQAGPSQRLPPLRSNRGRDLLDITRQKQPPPELHPRRGLQAPIMDSVSSSQEAGPPFTPRPLTWCSDPKEHPGELGLTFRSLLLI